MVTKHEGNPWFQYTTFIYCKLTYFRNFATCYGMCTLGAGVRQQGEHGPQFRLSDGAADPRQVRVWGMWGHGVRVAVRHLRGPQLRQIHSGPRPHAQGGFVIDLYSVSISSVAGKNERSLRVHGYVSVVSLLL